MTVSVSQGGGGGRGAASEGEEVGKGLDRSEVSGSKLPPFASVLTPSVCLMRSWREEGRRMGVRVCAWRGREKEGRGGERRGSVG